MIYSNACAYAIRAMARLALLRPEGYILLDELCDNSDLPRHFVAKIFQELVRRGLLISAKGRRGGFAQDRQFRRQIGAVERHFTNKLPSARCAVEQTNAVERQGEGKIRLHRGRL